MRKTAEEGVRIKKLNSKSVVRTGVQRGEKRTKKEKAKRKHEKNRKSIGGKKKVRKKARNTEQKVSLDPYQKEEVQ